MIKYKILMDVIKDNNMIKCKILLDVICILGIIFIPTLRTLEMLIVCFIVYNAICLILKYIDKGNANGK